MSQTPIVYIVLCLDVEGPASYDLSQWSKIEAQMLKLNSAAFKKNYPDSKGNLLKISYFIMDWTGFKENPTGRQLGYGAIYGQYKKFLFSKLAPQDYCIGWHYHHPYKDGAWRKGGWNPDWNENSEYEEQINHMVIERGLFPSLYRAGGTIETNHQSLWLEKWIPFDYSSRAPEPSVKYLIRRYKDILKLKYKPPLWNWSKAKADWDFYNPSYSNYQLQGEMKRKIFRCISIKNNAYILSKNDVRKAFKKAIDEEISICSFFTHDFHWAALKEVEYLLGIIQKVSKEYPKVNFLYADALTGTQKVIFKNRSLPEKLNLGIEYNSGMIKIKSNQQLFCQQPWLVIQKNNSERQRLDTFKTTNLSWEAKIKGIDAVKIGVGASNYAGDTDVKIITVK